MADARDADTLPKPTTPPAAPVSPQQFLCPYCATIGEDANRCSSCNGLFEPLSRQATQNAMGPWQIHDTDQPFKPGCSLDTLKRLIDRGRVTGKTVLRGPTTRQFWNFASNTPGVAALLGECHACHQSVEPDEFLCRACGATLHPTTDRQSLGLAPVKLLPGSAAASEVAASSLRSAPARPAQPRDPQTRPAAPSAAAPIARPTPLVRRSEPAIDTRARESNRRLRRRLRVLTWALGGAMALNLVAVVLIAFVLVTIGRPGAQPTQTAQPASTQPQPSAADAQPAETAPAPEADTQPEVAPAGAAPLPNEIDPRPAPPAAAPVAAEERLHADLAPWADRIEAATTTITGEADLALLEAAVEELRAIRAEAGPMLGDQALAERFPVLTARIRTAEARIARLRERDLF